MAKRNRRNGSPDKELEDAIEGTSEDRRSKSDRISSSRRVSKRRAERMALAERARKARMVKWGVIITVVVAMVVVASMFGYLYLKPRNVIMETNYGTIEIELFMDETPDTAGNFEKLMNDGFYDGLTFHRVIEGFMIQGGDPKGDGTGGPGYTIPDEASALELEHDYGVLSMANSGANTGGSQFFIVVDPEGSHHLDGKHAVFGKVVSGMDVAVRISKLPVDDNDKPLSPVVMKEVHYPNWYSNW